MEEDIFNYLIEKLGLWAVIGYLVLILFIVPLLITFFSKYIEIQFLTNLLLKKKNQSWIRIFRTDKSISQCLYEYDQLKSPMGRFQSILISLGLFVGNAVPLLLFIVFTIVKNIMQFDYILYFAISLSNLISSLVPLGLYETLRNRVKSVKHTKLESEFKYFNNLFTFSIFYNLSFAVFFLWINVKFLIPSELEFNINIFINIIIFLIILFSTMGLIIERMRFLYLLKIAFNKRWFKKFPKLCITTSGGVQISGIVKDAFNTDYIILNKNGNQVITLWSSVDSIEFYRKNK